MVEFVLGYLAGIATFLALIYRPEIIYWCGRWSWNTKRWIKRKVLGQ